nr:MAG TPA: TFIIB-TERMINAL DOMAIN, TFIIB, TRANSCRIPTION INITIATION [Caudoviricetes sp.]
MQKLRKKKGLQNMNDIMKKVIVCPKCGKQEYYGMLHWRDGKEMCRKCIYDVWESEGPWRRTPSDEVFPIYEDGKDYTLMTATERSTKSTQEIF